MDFLNSATAFYNLASEQNQRTLFSGSMGKSLARALKDLKGTLDAIADNLTSEHLEDLYSNLQLAFGYYESNVKGYLLFTQEEVGAVTSAFSEALLKVRKAKTVRAKITAQMNKLVLSLTDTRDQWASHQDLTVTLGDLLADNDEFIKLRKLVDQGLSL